MSSIDERILILTSTQKDSESTFKLLRDSKLYPSVCSSFQDLVEGIREGAGALLIAKEILVGSNLTALTHILASQESWSDLPVIILASTGDLTEGNAQAIKVLRLIRNTTVLERPVRVATLMSILESAIANRKRQYEVRSLLKDLMAARQEAVQANQAKSEFLANMSHEIRTPLGVMLGFTEFAVDESATPEERKKYLGTIQRNGRILLAVVNDILDLAKVEAGLTAIENIETAIVDVLKDVVAGFQVIAAEKNVRVSLDLPADFPKRIKTDPVRVRQIFTNILGNAVKFTAQGSVNCVGSIFSEQGHIKIKITVTDTGMGIEESHLPKIFKPFSQADSSMARKYGGTGLGLVLSRKLAQALGGDLKLVKTLPGVGSTFEMSFAALPAPEMVSWEEEATKKSFDSLRGLNVLLAEDSADNQFIISRVLSMVGVEVEVAGDGAQAIEKARSDKFDIILMDIQMPLMDGSEATERLREKGYKKPIIALTANALKGDRDKALRSGFDDYITKPIQRLELYESLMKFTT